jgi:4-oxalocrotonate tautomerase
VKLYPGRSEEQKKRLARAIVEDVIAAMGSGEESVSVTIEEIAPSEWKERVYKTEIVNHRGTLYKPPGYSM